jgi:signal recognition particle subunit SRP54
MEQLAILGKQIGVDTLPIVAGQTPVQIARRAIEAGRLGGYDVVMLDTAGRTHVDEALMIEVAEVEKAAGPHETLLVVDSLTGQDAVNVARSFTGRVNVTGVVLTRVDGDGRGGAALSMRAVTGKPIKLLGTSEKMDGLEDFHPSRIANRILGMGDIVSLVEKAAESIDAEKGMAIAKRMQAGQFNLDDMGDQLDQMMKLGGMQGLMGMLPGVKNMQKQLAGAMDDKAIKRQRAIIRSMTPWERRNPKEIDGKRRRRIARGSGTNPEEVNKLLKMHRGMADMMKAMGGAGAKRGPMAGLANMFGLGGGMPQPTPEMLAELQKKMPGGLPGALPDKMPALPPGGLPPGFPGLGGLGGGKLPGLPGFPFGKKK